MKAFLDDSVYNTWVSTHENKASQRSWENMATFEFASYLCSRKIRMYENVFKLLQNDLQKVSIIIIWPKG